jgi:hypothetical protein
MSRRFVHRWADVLASSKKALEVAGLDYKYGVTEPQSGWLITEYHLLCKKRFHAFGFLSFHRL